MKWLIVAVIIVIAFSVFIALPTIEIDKDAVVSSSAFSYIRAAMYFIPVNTVVGIGGIILGLWLFRTGIAFVKVLWDLLPVSIG